MQIEYVKYQGNSQIKTSNVPQTIVWNNARMIRNHSVRSCAREVLAQNMGLDVVKINVIGPPSTGKTTFMKLLAHLIHKEADTPYAVRIFQRAELLDMENTLAKLQPMNHVLVFDDVSWLSAGNNKAKLDQIQKTFTEIRHLPGGQDIKVVILFGFHYNLSIPKHLRQANFFCYTDIGSSEMENTQKLVGMKNSGRLIEFKKVVHDAYHPVQNEIVDGEEPTKPKAYFSYRLQGKGNIKFTYTMREPFAPAIWWNGDTLRHIVFPSREWVDKLCSICGDSVNSENHGDIKKFKKEGDYSWGSATLESAIKIILMKRGIFAYSPHVKNCITWIEKYFAVETFTLDEIMKEFELRERPNKCKVALPDHIIQKSKKTNPV